jgi:hypothetical protein
LRAAIEDENNTGVVTLDGEPVWILAAGGRANIRQLLFGMAIRMEKRQ